MSGDAQRLLRRNATAIHAAFAALWFVRGALTTHGAAAVALASAAAAPVAIACVTWKATGPSAARTVMRSDEGRALFRPVTWMTTAQLVLSVLLPWWAAASGREDWVLASIALTIGLLLIGLARPLAVPTVAVVGAAIVVVAVTLPLPLAADELAATMSSALGVLLTSSVVSLMATSFRRDRIGVAPG